MRRFIAKAPLYTLVIPNQTVGNAPILLEIDNKLGFETEDTYLINKITGHSDFGNLVLEVETKEEISQAAVELAKRILEENVASPNAAALCPVEPLTPPDLAEEAKKLAEEQEIKAKKEAEEQAAILERKQKNEALRETIQKKSQRKKGNQRGA